MVWLCWCKPYLCVVDCVGWCETYNHVTWFGLVDVSHTYVVWCGLVGVSRTCDVVLVGWCEPYMWCGLVGVSHTCGVVWVGWCEPYLCGKKEARVGGVLLERHDERLPFCACNCAINPQHFVILMQSQTTETVSSLSRPLAYGVRISSKASATAV